MDGDPSRSYDSQLVVTGQNETIEDSIALVGGRQEDVLIVRMTNELYEKNVQIDHLDIMNNHLQGMVSTLQHQQRDVENKNDRLRQENTALTRDIALLQEERKVIAGFERHQIGAQMEEIRGALLQQATVEKEQMLKSFAIERKALELSVENVTDFNRQQRAEIEALRQQLRHLSEQLGSRTVLYEARLREQNDHKSQFESKVGSQEKEIIRLNAQLEQVTQQLHVSQALTTETEFKYREEVTTRATYETELHASQEAQAQLEEEIHEARETISRLQSTVDALRGSDQSDFEQNLVAQVTRAREDYAAREKELHAQLQEATRCITAQSAKYELLDEEHQRAVEQLREQEALLNQVSADIRAGRGLDHSRLQQQGGAHQPYAPVTDETLPITASNLPTLHRGERSDLHDHQHQQHQQHHRRSHDSGFDRHPDETSSVVSNITNGSGASHEGDHGHRHGHGDGVIHRDYEDSADEVLRSSLQSSLRELAAIPTTARAGAGGRYGVQSSGGVRASFDSVGTQGSGTDEDAWLQELVGNAQPDHHDRNARIAASASAGGATTAAAMGIAFSNQHTGGLQFASETVTVMNTLDALAHILRRAPPPDNTSLAEYLVNELLNAMTFECATVAHAKVFFEPFRAMVMGFEEVILERLHQQEPSDDGQDGFGPSAHVPLQQQVYQQDSSDAHLRTPPPVQSARQVAVIQDTSSEFSPSTPQRQAVISAAGTPVQTSEVEHFKHTVFQLKQQLAHLQEVARRAVQDRDQLIQQQQRSGPASLQASPGGTLCVHCAHREQREIAIITKERQQAAEQVHSAVAGVVQEREGLREQLNHYREEVRHFEELAVRNTELGRHAAATLYEDQLSVLAAQVQQYAERCRELEESHRVLQALQLMQAEDAQIPAQEALPSGSLQTDGATQTAQAAPLTSQLPPVVATTQTGTDADHADLSVRAAGSQAEVSTHGAEVQTDAIAVPAVQDSSTETDVPPPNTAAVSMDSTVRDLRTQLEALQGEREASAATRESLEAALVGLRAELSAREADAERHSAERGDLLEEIEGLREELVGRSTQLEALINELAARAEATRPSAENPLSAAMEGESVLEAASLQTVVRELQQQAEQERHAHVDLIQSLRTDLAAADSRVLELTSELAAATAATSVSQAQAEGNHTGADDAHVPAMEERIASLTTKLAAERAEATAACHRLETEVQSLTAQLALHTTAATAAEPSEHGNREADLHLALSAAASDLAESRQQLLEKNRLLIEAEAQLWHQQKLSELLEKRIATQDVHCTELERARAELTSQLHAAEQKLVEERAARQFSATHAPARQVMTMDAAIETEAVTPEPARLDAPHHPAAVSAEPSGDHPAHILDHTPTPLQFLLPREFLDMTASLQIQMEAVKNISTLVVENLKEKSSREDADAAEREMVQLRSSLDSRISLVNDQIARLREQDALRQQQAAQQQQQGHLSALQTEHSAALDRLHERLAELQAANADLVRDNRALVQGSLQLQQVLQARHQQQQAHHHEGHGEEKDASSVVSVEKSSYHSQVAQLVHQGEIIEQQRAQLAEYQERFLSVKEDIQRLKERYRLKLKRQEAQVAEEKRGIVEWVHEECQRVGIEFSELLQRNREEMELKYASAAAAARGDHNWDPRDHRGTESHAQHREDVDEQTRDRQMPRHSSREQHESRTEWHSHEARRHPTYPPDAHAQAKYEDQRSHDAHSSRNHQEKRYEMQYDELVLRSSQTSLPPRPADEPDVPVRKVADTPPRTTIQHSRRSTPHATSSHPVTGSDAHTAGQALPHAVRFTPTVPPTPPPPQRDDDAPSQADLLKLHLLPPKQVKDILLRNSETTLSSGRLTAHSEHKASIAHVSHIQLGGLPSYAHPTVAFQTRQRTAQSEAALPSQAIHPASSAGDIAAGRGQVRSRSRGTRRGDPSRSRSPSTRSPARRREESHQGPPARAGSALAQGVDSTERGAGRLLRPTAGSAHSSGDRTRRTSGDDRNRGDSKRADRDSELSRSLREEDYQEFLDAQRPLQSYSQPSFRTVSNSDPRERRRRV